MKEISTERPFGNRIEPLDGLRAVAVTGVIWVHIWNFFGNISLSFAGIDWNKGIALAGVGVDLFFVISGFCMYLMYEKKADHDGIRSYGGFLIKRWRRIAPAFYAVVLFESLLYFWRSGNFPLSSFAAHLFFVNTFIGDNVLSPPFWSLATEWQFYLLLPFIFIAGFAAWSGQDSKDGKGSNGSKGGEAAVTHRWVNTRFPIFVLICLCIGCRIWLFHGHEKNLLQGLTVTSDKITYRFAEFGWGMLAARFYRSGNIQPAWLKGYPGFIISFAIVVTGRGMMVTGVYQSAHQFAFAVRALGEPVMTLGFSLLLINLILNRTFFSFLLSTRPMLFLGRISYSMYLWHWLIVVFLCEGWISRFAISNTGMQLVFLMVMLMVSLIGWLSWYCFELPYFKKRPSQGSENRSAATQVVKVETFH